VFFVPPISIVSEPGLIVSAIVASGSSAVRIWSKYATCRLVPRRIFPLSGSMSPRISFSSVVFPQPLGPISPILSPRINRVVKWLISVRPP
jgi:hypothetical protein